MPIAIYTSASSGYDVSQNNTFTNPFAVTFDGQSGGVIQKRLYVRNNTNYLAYSGINISVVDNIGISAVDDSHGYSWKLAAGDAQPTDETWTAISPGNTIVLSGLGNNSVIDTSTYVPFWVRIEVPRGAPVETISDVQFIVTAQEYIVT